MLVILKDEAVNIRSGHNEIISADASSSISEVSVPVQGKAEDGASQGDTNPRDNLRSPISNTTQKKIAVHWLKLKEDIISEVDVNYKTVFKVVYQAGGQVVGVGAGVERDI